MHEGGGIAVINIGSSKIESVANLGWATMSGVSGVIDILSSMLVSEPDFSRYCKKPIDANCAQTFVLFISRTTVLFLGLAARPPSKASGAKPTGAYGTLQRHPGGLLGSPLSAPTYQEVFKDVPRTWDYLIKADGFCDGDGLETESVEGANIVLGEKIGAEKVWRLGGIKLI